MASSIVETIDIAVPVRTAYNQWTQFEEFPQFMQGVESVRQIDDANLHWCAEMGGKHKEWTAKITEQIPDKRIAWTSTQGAHNAGVVTFHRLSEDTCRVTLQLEYEPEGALETVGDAIGIVQWNTRENLERFKEFIEQRGEETGAFRGEIQTPEDRREHAAQQSQSANFATRMPGQTTLPRTGGAQQSGSMPSQTGRTQQQSGSTFSQQQPGSTGRSRMSGTGSSTTGVGRTDMDSSSTTGTPRPTSRDRQRQ